MDYQESGYTPRPGSKVSAALEAMKDGPMAIAALAVVMKCPENNVSTQLGKPLHAGLIVKLVDAAGVRHFMPAQSALPDGFKLHESAKPEKPAVNPADPFGLVGKRNGAAGSPEVSRPTDAAPTPARQPAAPAAAPAAPAGTALVGAAAAIRPAGSTFLAALFSNGQLMIQVDDDQVFLTPEHQRQLQQYCARFEGAE